MGEPDRMAAWSLMAKECKELRDEKRIVKTAKDSGYRTADVAKALKKVYGTSGHSLCVKDPRMGGGFRIIGFIEFSPKGILVTRYREETASGEEERVMFDWMSFAKAAIFYIKEAEDIKEETKAEAFEAGKANARSCAGRKQKGQEEQTMSELAKGKNTTGRENGTELCGPAMPGRVLSLADYEARIEIYKEQIGTGYIGIGRTLNEAKESGAVPHGQWEAWVTRTTGLSLRNAQRCMQAATEIRDGSALAKLEMSKALMLLGSGLDEDQQEAIAAKAADEGATVKQLRAELKAAKLKNVADAGTVASIRAELKKAEEAKNSLQEQMKATIAAYQNRISEEREEAYRQGAAETDKLQTRLDYVQKRYTIALENLEKAKDLVRGEVEREYDETLDKANGQIARLSDQLKDARKEAEEDVAEELEALRRELEAARRDLDDATDAAEAAEHRAANANAELAALKAGADPARKAISVQLGDAAGEFMRVCSTMPYCAEELMQERGAVIGILSDLEGWLERMFAAVGQSETVTGEGAVE